MAHITQYNAGLGIIETQLTGEVFFDEVRQVIHESTQLAREHGCTLWLTDYSAAVPSLTTFEIYELPALFAQSAEALNLLAFQIRRAIVVSRDAADFPFARLIAANRGQSLELFDNLAAARAWLKNSQP